MTRNNNQVKDKYKARIYKGKNCQMNLKYALKGSTLTARALYRCGISVLGKDIWEYKKGKQRQQDDKHLINLRNATKSHQKCIQTYHKLIANKKKKYRSTHTAQDWTNYLIARKRKEDPVLPIGKSSDFKPKMIESEMKIGHNSVMSIIEFFIDRYYTDHILDHLIHDMEGIGDTSAEGSNGMVQLSAAAFSFFGSAAL